MSGRIVTERLLATTSVAALMLAALSGEASATACTTVGAGGTYNAGGTVPCVTVTGAAISVANVGGTIGGTAAAPTLGAVLVQAPGGALSGGINNTGTIYGHTGGGVSVGIGVEGNVGGGITNSGTVSAGDQAIRLFPSASFGGGISNSGSLVANNTAILAAAGTFTGGILNSSTGSIVGGGTIATVDVTSDTFSGGISNAGTITTTAFGVGVRIDGSGDATFIGGITNSGTVGAFKTGVLVQGLTSFSGNIVNTTGHSITSHSCAGALVQNVSNFAGGITNSGLISGNSKAGIYINTVLTFAGGITNSGGTIGATNGSGIEIDSVSFFAGGIVNSAGATIMSGVNHCGIGIYGVSAFTGGITNAGTITAGFTGIVITSGSSTFSGGIMNTGAITGTRGIVVHGASFLGGITNAGTINGTVGTATEIDSVATFSNGITNNGVIAAQGSGIDIVNVGTFGGGITNTGRIASATITGIDVNATSFAGGITNSGTVTGAFAGIDLYQISTFSGNVVNQAGGTIAGTKGIFLGAGTSFVDGAIINAGLIQGTGGTAIDLSQAGGAMTVQQAGGTILGTILFSSHGDTLSGYGTVVGDITQGNATIAPTLGGDNILKIAGNLSQNATSKSVIEVSPAAAAQLQVTGTASIAGGLTLVFDPGTYSNKMYTLVHSGTLSGTYAGTTTSGSVPGGTQTISYTTTDVDLTLANVPNPVVTTTTGVFGDPTNLAVSGFFDIDDMVFDHIDETQFGQGADQVKTALAGTAPMQIAMNGPLQQLAQAGSQMSDTLARYGAWVRGVGNFLDVDNQGAASGFSASGGGVLAGIDHPFGPLTLGIAGGYSGTDFRQNDGESGDIQTIRGMVYAHYRAAPRIIVDGIAGIAYDRIHTARPITALSSTASESHNAWEENLALQAGYVMPWQGFTLIPRVGAQYLHLAENRFSESGGSGFDLSRGAQNVDSFQPLISLAALHPFTLGNGMHVTPEFKLTYSHELLNPNETLALTTPSGSIVPASAITPAHNTVTLGPSVTLRLNNNVNLFADYKLAIGVGKSTDHVIAAGARFTW
jgi:outer membrane autotransporter protein